MAYKMKRRVGLFLLQAYTLMADPHTNFSEKTKEEKRLPADLGKFIIKESTSNLSLGDWKSARSGLILCK